MELLAEKSSGQKPNPLERILNNFTNLKFVPARVKVFDDLIESKKLAAVEKIINNHGYRYGWHSSKKINYLIHFCFLRNYLKSSSNVSSLSNNLSKGRYIPHDLTSF